MRNEKLNEKLRSLHFLISHFSFLISHFSPLPATADRKRPITDRKLYNN